LGWPHQLPFEQRPYPQVLMLADGERHLLVEHVLVHAHLVAVGVIRSRLASRMLFSIICRNRASTCSATALIDCGELGSFLRPPDR